MQRTQMARGRFTRWRPQQSGKIFLFFPGLLLSVYLRYVIEISFLFQTLNENFFKEITLMRVFILLKFQQCILKGEWRHTFREWWI
jgi:hypothetical protein